MLYERLLVIALVNYAMKKIIIVQINDTLSENNYVMNLLLL